MNIKTFLIGVLLVVFSLFIPFFCELLINHSQFVAAHHTLQIPMIGLTIFSLVGGFITIAVSLD